MSTFCPKCENIIDNLFDPSRYQPCKSPDGKLLPHVLEQEFHILDNYRDIVTVSENCSLCALIKKTVLGNLVEDKAGNPILPELGSECTMQIQVRGGNVFRPAFKDGGLQLRDITVGTALDRIGLDRSGMGVHFSITAENGMVQWQLQRRG